MSNKVYSATLNNENKWCVTGPGNGLGYYAGTLHPELSCESEEEARRAALIADIAYEMGKQCAQFQMRQALGIRG